MCLVIGVWGCATAKPSSVVWTGMVPAIGQADAQHPDARDQRAAGPSVIAQGWASSGFLDRSIVVSIANRGTEPLRFSEPLDTYVARLSDGRTVELKKRFVPFSSVLDPGMEGSVTLRLPRRVSAREILQLVATLNEGKTVVILHPVEPLFQQADGARISEETAPMSSSLSEAVLSGPEIHLAGTVPVIVEFDQEFGGTLAVDVRWDEEEEAVRLTDGERRLFSLLPGQHELHAVIRVSGLGETRGRVPLVVVAGEPIRVVLNARARLEGVELKVRVWQGNVLAVDETL